MLMCVVKIGRGCNLDAMRLNSKELLVDEKTPSKKDEEVGEDQSCRKLVTMRYGSGSTAKREPQDDWKMAEVDRERVQVAS